MGWKAVKDHYDIEHSVHVLDGNLCVAFGSNPSALTVSPEGRLIETWGMLRNTKIIDILAAIEKDREAFAHLFVAEDVFDKTVTVYTYRAGDIFEKQCEEVGQMNVTHDGELMYENLHSTDKDQVVSWAKLHAEAAIERREHSVEKLADLLNRARIRLHNSRADLEKLNTDFPTAAPAP